MQPPAYTVDTGYGGAQQDNAWIVIHDRYRADRPMTSFTLTTVVRGAVDESRPDLTAT